MIRYLIAFMLFTSPCLAGMGIGGFPYPGPGVMVVATTSYTDDFNDGALGSDWTALSVGSFAATPTISSGKFVSGTNGTRAGVIYTAATFTSNQYSQVRMGASTSAYIGITTRMTSGCNGYIAQCANSTTCGIYKTTSGITTAIGAGITVTDWAGKLMRLESNGNTHTLYFNGVAAGSRTDSTYTDGSPGVHTSASSSTYGLDDFEGGNL